MADDDRAEGAGDDASADKGLAQYSPTELQQIRGEFASGRMPVCPRCAVAMTRREIGGGSFGVGSAIFDIHRGTRT